jgi:hypothetical protein
VDLFEIILGCDWIRVLLPYVVRVLAKEGGSTHCASSGPQNDSGEIREIVMESISAH